MAIRYDVVIDWSVLPRTITVQSPSTEITMQDTLDTLSYMQAGLDAIDEKPIVDASGKEPLDTVTKNGITVSLLDARLGFEARLDWTQCSFSGGNLVAFDGVQVELRQVTASTPVNPTPFVNIDRASSSSGTLQEQDALQYSSYGGVVTVDPNTTNPYAGGLEYPSGNKEFNVDNVPNAVLIALDKGFDTLELKGTNVLTIGDNPTGLKIRGQNKILTVVEVQDGADVLNCEFSRMTISGILDGGSLIEKCDVGALQYVNGEIFKSTLQEFQIVLGGNKEARFIDCYSGVSGTDTAKINMNGSGQSLLMRNFSGGIRILGRTGTDGCSLDFNSGHCIIDSTCTGNSITVRGTCKLTVEAGATAPLIDGKAIMVQDDMAFQVFEVFRTTDI